MNDPRFDSDTETVDILAALYQAFRDTPEGSAEHRVALGKLLTARYDFIENCFSIVNKSVEKQYLILKPAQLRLFELIEAFESRNEAPRIVVLKARQLGLSTAVAGYNFFNALTQPNSRTIVLAHRADSAETIFGYYTHFYDNLDERIRPRQGIGSRQGKMLVLAEQERRKYKPGGLNSRIQVIVPKDASASEGTGKIGRSMSANHLHISELGFWQNPTASMGALLHSFTGLDARSSCIIESTAEKAEDYFHQFWKNASEGRNDFAPLFIAWFDDESYLKPFRTPEERARFEKSLNDADSDPYGNEAQLLEMFHLTLEQLHWRRDDIRNRCNGDVGIFSRENPSTPEEAFRVAGGNYLNGLIMDMYIKSAKPPLALGNMERVGQFSPPVLKPSPLGNMTRVWETAKPYHEYLVAADISENLPSGDFSAAVVLKRLPLRVVAVLRGISGGYLPTTSEFSEQICLLSRYYNEAYLCIESNAIGKEVIRLCRDELGYPNLVYEQLLLPELQREAPLWGFRTSSGNRRILVDGLKEFFESERAEVYDEHLLRECAAMVRNEHGRVQAPRKGQARSKHTSEIGFYDDMAFALAIAYHCHLRLPPPLPPDEREYQLRRQALKESQKLYGLGMGRGDDTSIYRYV